MRLLSCTVAPALSGNMSKNEAVRCTVALVNRGTHSRRLVDDRAVDMRSRPHLGG